MKTVCTAYTIPFPKEFVVSDEAEVFGYGVLRDEVNTRAEELERHQNDLYQLFLLKLAFAMQQPHTSALEEEKLFGLLRTIFEVKRTLEK